MFRLQNFTGGPWCRLRTCERGCLSRKKGLYWVSSKLCTPLGLRGREASCSWSFGTLKLAWNRPRRPPPQTFCRWRRRWNGRCSFCTSTTRASISWILPRTNRSLSSRYASSASFLAGISVRSPRKLFNFYYLKKHFLDQSIQKNILFHFENRSTVRLYTFFRLFPNLTATLRWHMLSDCFIQNRLLSRNSCVNTSAPLSALKSATSEFCTDGKDHETVNVASVHQCFFFSRNIG